MELHPLVHGQRAEDGVIEHFAGAQALSRACPGFLEAREVAAHSVKHRAEIELTRRDDVLWRFAPRRKIPEAEHGELLQALFERGARGERRAFFHAAFETLRGSGIRARQVLDDLDDRPLLRIAAGTAFVAGAFRGIEDDREAVFEVCIHWLAMSEW